MTFSLLEHLVSYLLCGFHQQEDGAFWWWGTAHSEIRGDSTKQYSRQTPVFLRGGDAREHPGGLLRLDPAFAYAEPPSS